MSAQIKDGGPACGRAGCDAPSVRKQGRQYLCAKHYRFGQMRVRAKRDGKVVPAAEQMENLLSWVPDLVCGECHRQMNWLAEDGTDTVLTLQHYRSGSMAFICLSCNSRHASMPGDTFCSMPALHKRCPQCEQIKPFSGFARDNGRTGPIKLKSWCKACSSTAHTNWQRNNRDHYNAKQRENRASRNG
ncbi:MAG TPA: hypothetical protein VN612_13910 [Acidobacteriaceae bacterium]|nr:hypothetical protein [Acidobacteriaceae bacterium]